MIRNIIGAVLALVGATAAVWSPFVAWYDGRLGRDYEFADLFQGISQERPGLWLSLLLPMVVAAAVTLIGLVLRSRLVIALAGVIVLGFTILWMVRQGQAAGNLAVTGDNETGLGVGLANALGGGLLLLLAASVLAGRVRRPAPEPEAEEPGYTYPPPDRTPPPRPIPGPDRPEYPGYPEDRPYRDEPPGGEPPTQPHRW
ncbi:hypothetical protein ACFPM3_22550 [Streptomyces coeruleoprunus]|uniref:Uncharacterized protein n=1 Tax=Streptomyces coeruleoprunus TaxID=285563 RepID=A0ABV9XIS2_9ACTN